MSQGVSLCVCGGGGGGLRMWMHLFAVCAFEFLMSKCIYVLDL